MNINTPFLNGGDMPRGTKSDADLDLLSVIEEGEVVSQVAVSKRIGVAVGLINALLKRAVSKGYVKVRQVPRKRFAYYLTPQGFAEKSRLVAEYLECSLDLYRKAKEEYAALFHRAKLKNATDVVLVGGGELAEIAILVSNIEAVEIASIVIPGSNLADFHGIPVVSAIDELRGDECLVITDMKAPQAAYDALAGKFAVENILTPEFLRISRDRSGGAVTGGAL